MKHKEQARFRSTLKGVALVAGAALVVKSGATGIAARFVREHFTEAVATKYSQVIKEYAGSRLLFEGQKEIARLESLLKNRVPSTLPYTSELDLVKYVHHVGRELGISKTVPIQEIEKAMKAHPTVRGMPTAEIYRVVEHLQHGISLPEGVSQGQVDFIRNMTLYGTLTDSQRSFIQTRIVKATPRLLPTSKASVWDKLFEPTATKRLSLYDIQRQGAPAEYREMFENIQGQFTEGGQARNFFDQLVEETYKVGDTNRQISELISIDSALYVNKTDELLSVKGRKEFFSALYAKAADIPLVPIIGYNPLTSLRSMVVPFYGPETMFHIFSGQAIPGFKGSGMYYNIGTKLYNLANSDIGVQMPIGLVKPMKTSAGLGRYLSPAIGFGFRPRSFREYALSFLLKDRPSADNLYPPTVMKLFKNDRNLTPDSVFGYGRIDERVFLNQMEKFLLQRSKFEKIPVAAHDIVIAGEAGKNWKVGELLANRDKLLEALGYFNEGTKIPGDVLVSRSMPEFAGLTSMLDPGHLAVGKKLSGEDIAVIRMLKKQGDRAAEYMRTAGVDEPLNAWLNIDFERSTVETRALRQFLKDTLLENEALFTSRPFDKPHIQWAREVEAYEKIMYPFFSRASSAVRATVDEALERAVTTGAITAEEASARGLSQGSAIGEVISGLIGTNKAISQAEGASAIWDAIKGSAADASNLMTDRYSTSSMMWHQLFMPISQFMSGVPLVGNFFRDNMANPKRQLLAIAAATTAIGATYNIASFVDFLQRKGGHEGLYGTAVNAWVNINLGLASMRGEREEKEKYYLEGEKVIRKGRFWTLSNTPFLGEGAIATVPNIYKKKEARGEYLRQMYGEEEGDYWSWYLNPLRSRVFDRYHQEKLHYRDMPYEISAPPFDPNTPHGAVANLFLGWIKPPIRLQQAIGAGGPGGGGGTGAGVAVTSGDITYAMGAGAPGPQIAGIPIRQAGYGSTGEFSSLGRPGKGTLFSRDVLVGLNETSANLAAAPAMGTGVKEGLSQVFHSLTEVAGLRGWALQELVGEDQLFRSRFETPGDYFSAGFALKDLQLGGLPYEEFSEIPRRLWAPPRRGQAVNRIRNDQPTWMPGCFIAGTKVLTDKGMVTIESLAIGDRVLSHDGTFNAIEQVNERDYTDYLIEIEAQGISSNIISTQDHPFLVIKSDRCPYHKRNRYCIPGLHPNNNKPCKYCKTKQYSEPEWTAAQSITPGDFVLEPIIQSVPRCSIPDIIQKPARGRIKLSNYSIEDDFITGVAIGFYLSEGHATKYNVVFGSGKNEEHQRIALDDFCSRHSVHTHHKPVYREDGTGCIVSQANSVELCAWLRSQFGHLSNSKYIPDWVYSSSDELKLGIVSGYIEGDGCCFNGSLSATSTSLSLLTSIKAILAQFEIISSSGREDKKEQYTITISAQGGYKLRQLTNSYGRKISRTTDTNHQSGSVVHKGYILRRVKSVNKKDTKCKVYNLQVANTQTYNAYGIAVHNSDNFINFRMGNPYCVSPETLIETGKLDFKKAKDVIIQDELVTHKGNLISPIAIFDRLRTEDEKAYRVNIASLSGVDIVVSKEHPFLVCSNVGYQSRQPLRLIKRYEYANTILRVLKDFPNVKKKQISELTGLHPANVRVILDFMAKDRKITKDLFGNIRIMDKDEYDLYMIKNRFEWKNADKLVPGDYVVYPRPLANPEVLKDYNCPLLRILTLDRLSGFAMGLFLAEGSTDKNQIYLSLHQKEEETLLPIFNDWLVSIRQNPLKVYKDGRLYNGRSRKGIKCCRHNPSLAKVLRDVFGNNSHNKSIPDWVMDAPDEFVLGLIHGYLEGDGYDRVRHDGYGTTLILSFSSCNQQLLLQIRKLLLRLGIRSNIYNRIRKNIIIGESIVENSIEFTLKVYGNDASVLAHKMNLDIEIPFMQNKNAGFTILTDDFIFMKVYKTEEVQIDTDFIGFDVPQDNSFCVAGIATHNSKIIQGIYRLPGRTYEATHGGLGEIVRHPGPSILGKSEAEIIAYLTNFEQNLPSYQEEILEAGTMLHRSIQQELETKGILIDSEVEVRDPESGLTGYIDAIIQGPAGPAVVEIKTAGKNTMNAARAGIAQNTHISQANFYMYSLGLNDGYILYVNRANPSDRMLVPVQMDKARLTKDLETLGSAQQKLASMMERGLISPYETYKPMARADILADVAPWSPEYEVELKKAQEQAHSKEDKIRIKEIQEKARMMKKRHVFDERLFKYPLKESPAKILGQVGAYTFKVQAGDDVQVMRVAGLGRPVEGREDIAREKLTELLMNTSLSMRWVPGEKVAAFYVHGTSVAQAMREEALFEPMDEPVSAADYEAIHGKRAGALEKAWESIIHADTPITNKLGKMSALEHYSRRQLYGDQYMGFNLFKHVKATYTALSSKDPLPAATAGAAVGVVLNLTRGARRSMTGGVYGAAIGLATSLLRTALNPSSIGRTYIPRDERQMRDIEEWFDRIKYIKFKMLFEHASDLSDEYLGINLKKLADIVSSTDKLQNIPPEIIIEDQEVAGAYDQADQILNMLQSGDLAGLPDIIQKGLYYKHQYESTVVALDTRSSVAQMMRALPKRMRGYIPSWLDAGEEEQEEILKKVPSDTRRALMLQWHKSQPKINLIDYFQSHWLPSPDHEIWNPDTSLDDFKVNVAHDLAIDAHELNLWPSGREGELECLPSIHRRTPDVKTKLTEMFVSNNIENFNIKVLESNTYNSRIDVHFNIKEDRTKYYAENILMGGYL